MVDVNMLMVLNSLPSIVHVNFLDVRMPTSSLTQDLLLMVPYMPHYFKQVTNS
jgi:hypothetical protein